MGISVVAVEEAPLASVTRSPTVQRGSQVGGAAGQLAAGIQWLTWAHCRIGASPTGSPALPSTALGSPYWPSPSRSHSKVTAASPQASLGSIVPRASSCNRPPTDHS